MSGIGLVGQSMAGGVITSSPNTKGTVNGRLVVVLGSTVEPHGSGPHAAATMVQATAKGTIDGIPVCREGDLASCGHPLTLGAANATSD